jgi:signal transduction histidine kinase
MAAAGLAPAGSAPSADALETELGRRVFLLARQVSIGVLVGYGVVFALANSAVPALMAWALAAVLALATAQAARRGAWVAGLTGMAWTLAPALVLSALLQGGLNGSSIWWLGTLPALLMHAHLQRQAVAMTGLLVAAVVALHVAAQAGWLPAPVLMPLGDLQRAVAIVGALLLLGLTNLRAHRWREELMAELRRSRAAAQDAIRVRERFVANMSHEIRTPLNGIVGATELLRLSDLDPGQRRAVDVLRRSVDALGNMVDDVLDFSQLDGGRMKLQLSPVDLRELVHDCVELVAAQAEAKGLQLWAHCGRALPQTLVTDPVRLRQVLLKLLSNAVKFTETGGVRLGVHAMAGSRGRPVLALTVRDTGIGMSAQQQAGLFEAFAQGDTTTTRRHGGAGLGLVICHALVRRLGGRIKVNSRLVGGSTFAVCLPWPNADAPPPPGWWRCWPTTSRCAAPA